jgi:hypothetical protein
MFSREYSTRSKTESLLTSSMPIRQRSSPGTSANLVTQQVNKDLEAIRSSQLSLSTTTTATTAANVSMLSATPLSGPRLVTSHLIAATMVNRTYFLFPTQQPSSSRATSTSATQSQAPTPRSLKCPARRSYHCPSFQLPLPFIRLPSSRGRYCRPSCPFRPDSPYAPARR